MSNPLVLAERHGPIYRLALNRPDKKNALTLPMYEALTAGLKEAAADPAIRAVVLEGDDKCFTAGNDIADFASGFSEEKFAPIFHFLEAIHRFEKPVIARVHGVAVGIGTTVLLHCDMVIAGESAKFCLPFTNLGLCPEAASSWLLPRLMGHQRASELLLLGQPFPAQRALEFGLVNYVLPDSEVRDAAWSAAEMISRQPAASVRLTKAFLKQPHAETVSAIMREEAIKFGQRLSSPEAAEAFAAFAQRRQPDFSKFD